MSVRVTPINLQPAEVRADWHWIDGEGQYQSWPVGPAQEGVAVEIPAGQWGHPDFGRSGHWTIFAGQENGVLRAGQSFFTVQSNTVQLADGHSYRWNVSTGAVEDITTTTGTTGGNGKDDEKKEEELNLLGFLTEPIGGLGLPPAISKPIILVPVAAILYKVLLGRGGLFR